MLAAALAGSGPIEEAKAPSVRGISVFMTKLVHCAANVCKWHLTDIVIALSVRFRGQSGRRQRANGKFPQ